jgi:hypothetical protein
MTFARSATRFGQADADRQGRNATRMQPSVLFLNMS